jgi:hypothetical protein
LMDRWGWSKSKVRLYLTSLAQAQMIVKKTDKKKTTLNIVNYSVYQESQTTEEPQKNHRKTTEKPQKDTINKLKNVKNEKNEKKLKDIYISVQHLTLSKEDYEKLVNQYGQSNVDDKIEYAKNYKNLKNYVSLYLTLNNWLKADKNKPQQQSGNPFLDMLKERGIQ